MLLIGNGRVITRDSANPFIENGAVLCDGKLIKEVGTYNDLKAKYPQAEFIDAKGGLIMPGLINAHNHIYSAMSRGISIKGYNPKGFLDILDGFFIHCRHILLDLLILFRVGIIKSRCRGRIEDQRKEADRLIDG